MKSILFVAIFGSMLLSGALSLQGALPPLYQSSAEIASLVQDHELGKILPDGEPIIGIRKISNGYLVITTNHQVEATIIYEPSMRPGPALFKVKFQSMEALDKAGDNE